MLYSKGISCLAVLLVVLSAAACSNESASAGKLTVVTSIRPLALMVEQLAGDAAEVQTLLSANADPHNMALRISERQRLEQANLVVWLGPDFERFLQNPMATRAAAEQLVLGELAQLNWPSEVESMHKHGHDQHDHHGRDMHLWLDPANGQLALRAIHAKLIALRPDLQALLDQRLKRALAQVEQAKSEIKQQLEPVADRGFGVGHNAYGHFVAAFGLRQLAALNEVPGQRLSAKQRHQLQQQLTGAACLLVERRAQATERLAEAIGITLVVADPLAGDPKLTSYSEFLRSLGDDFYRCLTAAEGA